MTVCLSDFCRQRDLNGVRLMTEEIARQTRLLEEKRAERNTCWHKNTVKLVAMKQAAPEEDEFRERVRQREIRRQEDKRRDEDHEMLGQMSFHNAEVHRITALRDALAAQIAEAVP